ncbi:MAG: UvrD-helicase domain-containing protein [Clostridia bacterium]|nr:UvrD-helicase domain-containing protein [Clostridia bacterium]
MKWTNDQEKCIFAKPSEIVVSAAAGSGKTQVLTTRIIERIKDASSPVSVEKLLVVTFTKAAAAEMKERISKALKKAINESDDASLRKHLKGQLALLGSAQICTIDSFCYDVVKQNFFKVNLPSDISIGETGELSLLKLSALEETVNALYCALEKSKGNPLNEENMQLALIAEKAFPDKEELSFILNGFEALTNACSYDNRDSEFSENIKGGGDYTTMISELYTKAQSAAYPEKWLCEVADMYNSAKVPYTDTVVYKYVCDMCKIVLKNTGDAINSLAEVCKANNIGYAEFLRNEAQQFYEFARCNDYKALYDYYQTTKLFPTITGKNTDCDKELKKKITATRTVIKNNIKKRLPMYLEFSLEECESLRNQLYPQIKALCSATILLGKIYYEKMTERKIIDFSTCEHLALDIISSDGANLSDTGLALKNKYDEIYIDEFQDSNDLQDMLFSLISSGQSFMVGDVKQSIYGFRNADPSIFMKKCEESFFDEDSKKRKIFLAKNFRSAKSIIDGVNSIFDVVMTLPSCGVDYKKEQRLDFGTDFMPVSIQGEKCDIVIIEDEGNAEERRYSEAKYIAQKIKEIIKSKRLVWDKESGKQRAVKYSDIAILSRSVKNSADIFESVFSLEGVPCCVDGNSDLYETVEVGQVLEILRLIDNAQSDISLACALRSPMFMFDENELLKIRLCSKESFCDAFYGICSSKYPSSASLAKKCRKFLKTLTSWRNASGFITVEELIRRIYTDTNLYSNVLSFPDGAIRRANLDLLLEKAEEFERSSYTGLFNFVNYIEKIKKTSETTSEAKSVSDRMDTVRIMTIHKSKGLEFPIVFVTGCANTYGSVKTKAGGLIMNSHAGIGMNVINPVLRCKYSSPVQTVLKDIESKENAREEMRLFYVALTRAREKLYVVGALQNADKFEESGLSVLENLTANEILGAASYFSLMALAYVRGADEAWNLEIVSPPEICEDVHEAENADYKFSEDKVISSMLEYEYPYKDCVSLPNKASVTFLKSLDINLAPSDDGQIPLLGVPSSKKIMLKRPDFGKKEGHGTFFGTVHHKVLQYIDYNGDSVIVQCRALLEKRILSEDEFAVIDADRIERFMDSDLGKMLKKADKICREESFVISVGANEISPLLPESESICIQGIIDCYFEYEDRIILIDYKTDVYENPAEITEKYAKQLYFYELALKKRYKQKIIQKYLYLMYKNDIIELQ